MPRARLVSPLGDSVMVDIVDLEFPFGSFIPKFSQWTGRHNKISLGHLIQTCYCKAN